MLWWKVQVESGMCMDESSDSVPIVWDRDMVSDTMFISLLYVKSDEIKDIKGEINEDARKDL